MTPPANTQAAVKVIEALIKRNPHCAISWTHLNVAAAMSPPFKATLTVASSKAGSGKAVWMINRAITPANTLAKKLYAAGCR